MTERPIPRRVTIVGSGAAGISTAVALRGLGFDGAIRVIGSDPEAPYDRPPLSKEVLSGKWSLDDVRFHPESHYRDLDIEVLLGREARSLDAATRTVTLADGTLVEGDVVVIATGVRPRPHPVVGVRPHAFQLTDARDVDPLRAELVPGTRVVVVGAGFLGLELAASAAELGCLVEIIELAAGPLAGRVPESISGRLAELHTSHGVKMRFGRAVARVFRQEDAIAGLELDDGTLVRADVVIVAIGTVPNVEWLDSSGLDVAGGVASDALGRTTADGIYVVGDVARVRDARTGREGRREHRSNAAESAQVVATQIMNAELPVPVLPSFWTDQYDVKLQFVGEVDASAELEITEATLASDRFSGFLRSEGKVIGAFAWNSPRSLTQHRRHLAADQAIANP